MYGIFTIILQYVYYYYLMLILSGIAETIYFLTFKVSQQKTQF